jgi:putative spermidine/putrescine transport system permease protein
MRLSAVSLAAPLGLYFVGFVLVPLLLILFISLHGAPGRTGVSLGGYVRFFTDSYNRTVLLDTVRLGVRTTILDLLLGFPVAYAYVTASARWRRLVLFMVLLPLLTSTVVRTFAWVVILGNHGLINSLLLATGLTSTPLRLLYTPGAVTVAMAQIELPLMVLPLINTLSGLDAHLAEASFVLGAGRWRTLRRIVLPLCMPGLLTGTLLVFTGAVSALVTQTLVGGGQLPFMPFYIYEQAIQAQDYPFAACVATVLLITVLVIIALLNAIGRRSPGYIHG